MKSAETTCFNIRKWGPYPSLSCNLVEFSFCMFHLLQVISVVGQIHPTLRPSVGCVYWGSQDLFPAHLSSQQGQGSSIPEYKASPGRVRGLLPSLSGGSQFTILFLLPRCCHFHSHSVPPSHANNPIAINRAVHGRQRKERDMLAPLPLGAMGLDKQVGDTRASQKMTPAPAASHAQPVDRHAASGIFLGPSCRVSPRHWLGLSSGQEHAWNLWDPLPQRSI